MLILDDCSHCACVTQLSGFTRETAILALLDGTLGCDNCMDTDPDDVGHLACVALYENDVLVWDGRHKKV